MLTPDERTAIFQTAAQQLTQGRLLLSPDPVATALLIATAISSAVYGVRGELKRDGELIVHLPTRGHV
jgi:hypothetical protein